MRMAVACGGAICGCLIALVALMPALPARAQGADPRAIMHTHGERIRCRCAEWHAPAGRRIVHDDIATVLVPDLEARLGVRLMARTPGEAVHGSVSVSGGTIVMVDLYEEDYPVSESRTSPLLRASPAAHAALDAATAAACEAVARSR